MAWTLFSAHFRQTYHGGFRYLDRCGEFMLAAMTELDMIPGEAKPTGAKIALPELGLTANVDTVDLAIGQEVPNDGCKKFLEICVKLSAIARREFKPISVLKNGFALKFAWPFSVPEQMLQASLGLSSTANEMANTIGFLPDHQNLDYTLRSGSMELNVKLQPVTFERVFKGHHNPPIKALKTEQDRLLRFNKMAERATQDLKHAIMLEIDMMENDPAENSVESHFQQLWKHSELLQQKYRSK